jgi:type II secretory pathway component GspD/PulD (secretin)
MTPCLGDLPILGLAFKRTFRSLGKTELVVLITPRIIDSELREASRYGIEKAQKMKTIFEKEPPRDLDLMRKFVFPDEDEFLE